MSAILAVNAGSSSLKYALFGPGNPPERLAKGNLKLEGLADGHAQDTGGFLRQLDGLLATLKAEGRTIVAVGQRVVHGGPRHFEPTRVTPDLLEDLRRISPYDPEHLPAQIALMEHFLTSHPGLPQIACFDTSFHRDLPRVSRLLPIPRKYEAAGIRRYGFHGLSYAFLVEELGRLGGVPDRVVLAHLGSGSSLAAVRNGRSIDTTMAFTPSAGIPMSRRSGDLDPGLVAYLGRTEGMSPDRFHEMTSSQSGLLGISETSQDVRELLEKEAGDVRAAEALEIFCYHVKKTIGAYAAALGGLDALVFAGGIGENSAPIRERICRGLEYMDVRLDLAKNMRHDPLLSTGRVAVRVIRTDEEAQIARSTRTALGL